MKTYWLALLCWLPAAAVSGQIQHWKNKVYYVTPAVETKQYGGENYLIFETPVKGEELLLGDDGTLVLRHETKLYVYDAALHQKGETDMRRLNIPWDFHLLALDPKRHRVIVGIPMRDHLKYRLVAIGLNDLKSHELLTLADTLFPCYEPVAREREIAKKDPDFLGEFRFLVSQSGDFRGGFIRRDTLYLWTPSDPGLYFGQLIAVPLGNPHRILLSNRLHRFLGYDGQNLVYSIYTDPDGLYVGRFVVLRRGGKEIRSPEVELDEFNYYRRGKVYTNPRHVIKLYTLPGGQVRQIDFPGEGGLLMAVSPSGNRLFGVYYQQGQRHFGMYDLRTGRWTDIRFPLKENKPPVNVTYDGESFALRSQKNLILGYLNDDSRPVLRILAADTVRSSPATVRLSARDRAFVSGLKAVKWQGDTVEPGRPLSVDLKEGDNILTAEAEDRAGNKIRLKRKIVYVPED